ncbi:ABC transporter substrate-binding protein [Kribbella sp. NPDC058245]|uniref:ABC transporter substrate-binding protein n=1 Tax=Kribbella sp. NPDC058245 TaxID=3346399 RepID=UPI0036EDF800
MTITRRRFRVIMATGLALTALLAASACGGQGQNEADGKKTVRMLVNVTPALPVSFYEDLVAPFEQTHPGVTVKIEAPTAATGNVQETLTQQLAAGTEPDLLGGQTTAAEAKVMATLPDEPWVTDTPFAKELRIDGRQWTVGASFQAQSLVFYNKAAFAKAGITAPPTTVDELTAVLKKIKQAGGYTPLETAGEWVTAAQFQQLANAVVMQSNPNWYADRTKGSVTFTNSDYARYAAVYKSWIDDGLVSKNANGVKYNDSLVDFTSGKAATYVMGNWAVPTIDQAKPTFGVGVFPAPSFDGKPVPQVGGAGDLYSVLNSSKHKPEAFELVKYLVSDKTAVQKQLVAEGNFRAGFSYQASPLTQAVQKIVDAAPGAVVAGDGFGDNTAPSGWSAELTKILQKLYLGDSAEQAIAAMDKWWTGNAR